MKNWDDLRVVSAINRTGSFARAARDLDMDETTVGRRLARLEATLGVVLFEARHGHRIATDACKAILHHLFAIEQATGGIEATLRDRETPLRRLRLTTVADIAEHLLAPGLDDLLARDPCLALIIDASDQNVDMSRWEADLALRLGRPRHGAFTMRRVGTLKFCLVRPRDPAAATVVITYPDALAETPEMEALRQMTGGKPARIETASFAVTRRILEGGQAIGVLPDMIAAHLADHPLLVVEPLEAVREIWLLAQPYLRDDAQTRMVAEWCVSLLENPQGRRPGQSEGATKG